ncbi:MULTISPECIES: HNH endonuclease [Providencia]|uniref:HNH endonuclease n=1 Tax=Providencia TaxID=586 RepID=UPI0015EC80EB|nr:MULTISPECIES: HNH endonuclease signature motif containing protein [Providencia]QLQ63921.1 HNH endonuclease [Providencia rettgeri]URR24033.1 HNH endonuclease [Providencia rettgeri]
MARARNIKPGFFTNDDLAECDPYARILFVGLWTIADREGRLEDRPKKIKVLTLPFDDVNIDSLLTTLSQKGFINRYQVEGQEYIQIVNWAKHQNPHHKEIASVIPAPTDHKDTVCEGYIPLSNTIRDRIKERDGMKCNYCGDTDELQVDHITPISKGGNSTDDNLQILCKKCNVLKSNHLVNHEASMNQGKLILASSMSQARANEIASCPTDSLNLIPDSLNLIPYNTQAENTACPGDEKKSSNNVQPIAKKYAFEGQIIRLNQKDFDTWKGLFPNIDLVAELTRLDLEFEKDKPKNWFSTASAKLNYQNKNAKPTWSPNKRVASENFGSKDYGQTDIPTWVN